MIVMLTLQQVPTKSLNQTIISILTYNKNHKSQFIEDLLVTTKTVKIM